MQTAPLPLRFAFRPGAHELAATAPIRSAAPSVERELVSAELGSQYQIVRELGRGGMGVVFLARDVGLHRLVAIKVLRQDLSRVPEQRDRFVREARTTARLSHPNIVPVYVFGETRSLLYFVMGYVYGESLAERLTRSERLDPAEATRLIASLAVALDYAHREGVVHRDLKAENVLIARETGEPVLTDFGVSTLRSLDPNPADARRAFGTPHYMSPEQVAGEVDVDGRTDLYALGVLGYLMLTGRMPFDGPSFAAIAAKHLTEQPLPVTSLAPRTPIRLADAIERCLAKERSARWRHGRDLHEAIGRASPGPIGRRVRALLGRSGRGAG